MKKAVLLILLVFVFNILCAQNSLNILKYDTSESTVLIGEIDKITFVTNTMKIIKKDGSETTFLIADIDEITFITAPIAIGDNVLGGVVFYVDGSGDHGLVSAADDQSSAASYGCAGTGISGADGTAVGTGEQNTLDILAGCSTAGIAAKICNDLVLNGYEDWFLPSKDELNLMYQYRTTIGGFVSQMYWSSSENSDDWAWGQLFDTDDQSIGSKSNEYNIRAIRAF